MVSPVAATTVADSKRELSLYIIVILNAMVVQKPYGNKKQFIFPPSMRVPAGRRLAAEAGAAASCGRERARRPSVRLHRHRQLGPG
ncbi:hypothetical protein MRX96_059787 [Rhipicephalus microplus]